MTENVQAERNKLDQIIAGLYDFRDGGERSRRRIINQAGVASFLAEMSLDGPANDVAWDIERRLWNLGPQTNPTADHPLGSLLRFILTRQDLPQQEAKFVAGFIVKYSLIADTAYCQEISERYNLSENAGTLGLDTEITVSQRKELHRALLSAFPPQRALADMLRRQLNEDIQAIAPTASDLNEFIQEIINWAEENHRIDRLVAAARRESSGDPLLRAFAEQMLPAARNERG